MLLDHRGEPLKVSSYKKAPPPIIGEKFGNWTGRDDLHRFQLPGGAFIQFDLSRLTLADYRQMRDHYQVKASLMVLTFLLHQLEYKVVCDNKKIADFCQAGMDAIWTRLVRGLSQAFWAGFSPMILQWENNLSDRSVDLAKVKDLPPEECEVNWRTVDGYVPPGQPSSIPPKIKVYDGIKQYGAPYPVPVQNTLWYPVLSENGDYYGQKLLRSAFQPYFFSMLMHLFANRYYERFGEPVPVGRAPYDSEVDINGQTVKGNVAMQQILSNIRNRSVVVLPDDRGNDGSFDYQVEYLESQMRGADFERYMTRLDEEISLSLFTPLLVLRTADVGSYNLGTGQTQVYLWMLNAISGDWAEYINKYVLKPMKNFNFGERAPMVTIKFRKLGTQQQEVLRAVLTELVRQNRAKVDLEDLGQALGMRLTEIKEVSEPTPVPGDDPILDGDPNNGDPPPAPKKDTRVGRDRPKKPKGIKASSILSLIKQTCARQMLNAFQANRLEEFTVNFSYRDKLVEVIKLEVADPKAKVDGLFSAMQVGLEDLPHGDVEAFKSWFDEVTTHWMTSIGVD